MYKKFLSVLLIGMLSFSLVACGDTATEQTAQVEDSTDQQETEEETETQSAEEAAIEDTAEPEMEEAADEEESEVVEEVVEEVPEATEGVAEEADSETPAYTYTDMEATMYAKQSVNVRLAPDTSGDRVGSLSANQEVAVSGQCNETGWYRIDYNGESAYVSNNYLSDTKIEVAAADPAPAVSSEAAPAQETASASTSSGVPAGVLDLTTIPREQWVDRGDWLVYVHGVWNEYAISGQDIGPLMSSFNERRPDLTVSGGACKFLRDLGISVSWIEFNGGNSPEAVATMKYYSKYGVAPW